MVRRRDLTGDERALTPSRMLLLCALALAALFAAGPGAAVPPLADYINSNGDLNTNGQALGQFFAFLRDNYGVTKIDVVGHSDGGLWSRSAITQQSNYPGVGVTSLTTLGTPHTGSFV